MNFKAIYFIFTDVSKITTELQALRNVVCILGGHGLHLLAELLGISSPHYY